MLANFQVGTDAKAVNNHIRLALKRAVKAGQLKNPGATGTTPNPNRFRLADKTATAPTAAAKKPVKKAKTTGQSIFSFYSL